MRDIKSFLENLSQHPGVYQMLGEKGEVLYVGKAKNLKKRVSSYFSQRTKDPKTLSLVQQIKDIDITVTHSENEAVLLECNLIKKLKPRYNILLRDDKSYPYIFLSDHPFPRIELYRGQRKKDGLYFGPFPSGLAVRETIHLLQKLFLLRTCQESYFRNRTRPCLLHQINRCSAPCVNLINQENYAQSIQHAILFLAGKSDQVIAELQKRMEKAAVALDYEIAAHYRDQVARLRQIQEKQYVDLETGNADIIGYASENTISCIQLLSIRHGQVLGSRAYFPRVPPFASKQDVITAFLTQHYLHHPALTEAIPRTILLDVELAEKKLIENVLTQQSQHKVELLIPSRGEKKKWLAIAQTSAKQSLVAQLINKTNMQDRFLALQKFLHLSSLPRRIECYDISHSMGEATVASCVVFDLQGPVKRDYRRFNIKDITPGDDPAAMRQVLQRRFKQLSTHVDQGSCPDILLIDGGVTQLAVAYEVVRDLGTPAIILIGVAKGAGRKPGFETLHFIDRDPLHLPADSLALHLIQQIRDEAHRFAITGHRQRRDTARRHSTLESIPGIGAKRRRDLLRHFGGIQGVAHASLDELKKVPGINHSLAEKIFATLHDTTL